MSNSRYSMFFGLVRKAQFSGLAVSDHHELVREHTQGRTESLHDLSNAEYLELCSMLRRVIDPKAESADKMRKKLIGILKGCGYLAATGKADMPAIYGWVMKHGHLHVALNKYPYAELPRLVYQAEQYQRSYAAKLARS